jgi:hypothetical protein
VIAIEGGRPGRSQPFSRPFVIAAAGATAALVLVVLIVPGWTVTAIRWYVLFAGALAVGVAIRAITLRLPVYRSREFDEVGRTPRPAGELPARLREIDRLVSYSAWDVVDAEARLRPILRQIAAHRLALYRTIDLDADPDAARTVLGQRVWAVLAAGERSPEQGEKPIPLDDLRLVVWTLERLDGLPHE